MQVAGKNVKNSPGLISDLRKLVLDHPILKSSLSVLIGAVAGIGAAYTFIDAKVNSVAESRLAPYEQLFSGLSLNQGEEYLEATRVFDELVVSKNFDNLPRKSKSLAYDGLLLAITRSDDISDLRGPLKKVMKVIDESGEETPWRQDQIGWALIRLGAVAESKDYFEKAIKGYRLEKEFVASAEPTRGLLTIALIENIPDKAYAIGQQLKELRPSVYRTNLDLRAEIQEAQNTKFFDSFRALYGQEFASSIDQYVAKLLASD